jgi:eukaryotic-like serine/threonine-protein kinase
VVMDAKALGERYRVEERIAVGGMGAVYRATDTRLGRTVAVKVLKDGLAQDPRFVERFRREARSAAGLTHPNIAGVFDYGEEDGRYFIVMELADGIDLARLLLEEGPLPVERALKISAASADALGHAHRMGVIHRDVKPANIVVDAHDRVKVTDFGIARAAGDSTITQTGTILGTAFYLSPEQASGDNLGPHSDVYSLGVVLYEMLTGAVPFTGDSPVSVAMKHLNEEVPAPSSLKPKLPKEIDDLIAAATAKDPTARPADGTEFAARIRRAMGASVSETEGTTVEAAPVAAATTMEIDAPSPAAANPETADATWVLPGPAVPWGRIALKTLGGLAALVLLMLAFRALTGDEPRQNRGAATSPTEEPATAPAAEEAPAEEESTTPVVEGVTIPADIVGQDAHEWEKILKEQGLAVVKEKVPSEDFEKHSVVDTDPDPGSVVEPGGTVTLYESDGPPKEEKDDD